MQSRVHYALNIISIAVLTMMMTISVDAQVFHIQGGDSTLLNAQGGSVEFKASDYDGTVGMGYYNGKPEFGAEARYQFRGYTILAGDEAIPFTLPTDVFDASHYFSARGLGATRAYDDSRFYFFAGTTSTFLGTGFFNAATSDRPAGIFFYERKLNSQWKFFSREVVSNTQTALEGVEWKPIKWLKAAVSGGEGSNQKYFASSFDAETQKLAFKSSYVLMGDQFRRVTVISPMSSEVNKGNVQLLYKPVRFFSLTTGHENILEPLTVGGPMQQASIDQLSTDFHVAKIYFGSGLFSSNSSLGSTMGENFYLGRQIGRRFEVNTNYFESRPQSQGSAEGTSQTPEPSEATTVLSGTVRENFPSRFSLLQLVSHTAGQTTYGFGGDFTSNRFQVHADYENVYLPFRPQRPFEQALALNVMVRVMGPMQLTAVSNVAPDGSIRYSFGMSTYLYRQSGMAVNAVSRDSFSIAKYMIQGVVKDDQGLPVEGAAVHIGKEIAYSDSAGHFQARFSKHGPFALTVAPEEFMSNIAYRVVSAPAVVRADSDAEAREVQIIVSAAPARALNTAESSSRP